MSPVASSEIARLQDLQTRVPMRVKHIFFFFGLFCFWCGLVWAQSWVEISDLIWKYVDVWKGELRDMKKKKRRRAKKLALYIYVYIQLLGKGRMMKRRRCGRGRIESLLFKSGN